MAGTSQASPHVAGLAALILGEDPSLTPAEVLQLMRDGAVDLGAAGFDNDFGWGRISVIATLNLLGPSTCSIDADCDDGLFCNGAETCVDGSCVAGAAPNCNDGVACTTDTCNETTDDCDHTPSNAACSDGLFCNGAETCDAILGCQAGTAPNCNDAIACTADSCNESTDQCDHVPNNSLCDDGQFCNGAEVCNAGSGCAAGSNPCFGDCDEVNDVCLGGPMVWMTFEADTSVPGLGTVANEDIVAYDLGSGAWSMIFDGSDVGLANFALGAMHRLSDGTILLSVTATASIPGLTGGPDGTNVTDSDIFRFTPTSLGPNTAGSFSFYFDGSDVGLSANDEDIDAIATTSSGNLVLSVIGNFAGTGASGVDDDLFQFTATSLGSVTSGSFSIYFDGSDVSLTTTSEDVDAACITSSGTILLSTTGGFSVPGVSGNDEDILEFTPTSLGATTAGSYTMFLDLSTIGIATSADVRGVQLIE
jgi:hypothetical protein